MNSIDLIKKLILSCLLLSAGLYTSACAHERNGEHRWPPQVHHQRGVIRAYDYVYYPAQQAYFSPARNSWFWASGPGWQVGARLPSHLNVDMRLGGIPIRLASERPYVEHQYVERSYGNPWRAAHRGWHGRDERRAEWRAEWREEWSDENRAYENRHYRGRRQHDRNHERDDDNGGNRHRRHD